MYRAERANVQSISGIYGKVLDTHSSDIMDMGNILTSFDTFVFFFTFVVIIIVNNRFQNIQVRNANIRAHRHNRTQFV